MWLEVRLLSVLSRPQKDWDEFLSGDRGPRWWRTVGKLLWVIVPAGILAALIIYRYLG
jgi:hypothetical protein